MPSAIYTIEQLLRSYNSYVGKPAYKIGGATEVRVPTGYQRLDTQLRAKGREGLYGSIIALPCALDGVDLPGEPLISISASKNIIKTVIDGNDGTFKELFSNGDYQVVIRGVATNPDDPENYPEDMVRQLRTIAETKRHVKITNALTTLFNITHVAIEDVHYPDVVGQLGAQYFEFRCTSDREFILKVRDR